MGPCHAYGQPSLRICPQRFSSRANHGWTGTLKRTDWEDLRQEAAFFRLSVFSSTNSGTLRFLSSTRTRQPACRIPFSESHQKNRALLPRQWPTFLKNSPWKNFPPTWRTSVVWSSMPARKSSTVWGMSLVPSVCQGMISKRSTPH